MNLLDVVLLLLGALALLGGFRAGFLARVASWAGMGVGILLAFRTVPWAVELVANQDPPMRLAVGVGTFALTVSIAAAVTGMFGSVVRRTIAATPLGVVDRVLGSAASVAVIGGMVWLLAPAAADVPGTISQQVRNSTVVATIDEWAPEPPDAFRALRQVIATTRFPEVFADLGPTPQTGAPPEDIGVDGAVVDRALAATAHVRAEGCGKQFDGSSFIVGDGLLITNAHVVAGADTVRVRFPDGTGHPATVVVFDPDADLALLEVDGVDRDALALDDAEVGEDAAVLGYPGGQLEPRVAAARVEARRDATGRDIYGADRTDRRVLFLAAALRQGDSGSAIIDGDGNAIGVVFAISPDNPGAAYALDRAEVDAVLGSPRSPGDSGACM
ncbi:MAG: MarP family serine protease [Nitriliruptoraceae bacterium]